MLKWLTGCREGVLPLFGLRNVLRGFAVLWRSRWRRWGPMFAVAAWLTGRGLLLPCAPSTTTCHGSFHRQIFHPALWALRTTWSLWPNRAVLPLKLGLHEVWFLGPCTLPPLTLFLVPHPCPFCSALEIVNFYFSLSVPSFACLKCSALIGFPFKTIPEIPPHYSFTDG